jgi:hypothetical protein
MKSLSATLARLLAAYVRGKRASVRKTSEVSKGKSKRKQSRRLAVKQKIKTLSVIGVCKWNIPLAGLRACDCLLHGLGSAWVSEM